MIGFVSGVIMAMQMARALDAIRRARQVGQIVSVALVRELGPLLTALLVAGRNSCGIASEIGSMRVTEQIDAMRALGTDPIQKLVTPRLIATAFVLPLLTVIADFIGLIGGYVIAQFSAEHSDFAILDHGLAGPGVQRYGPGPAQAVCVRDRHRHGGMLLRPAHHRRNAGRGPSHHHRRGRGRHLDFHLHRADRAHFPVFHHGTPSR